MVGMVGVVGAAIRKGKISKSSPTSTILGIGADFKARKPRTAARPEGGMAKIAGRELKLAPQEPTVDLRKQNEDIMASLGLDTYLRPLKKKTDTLG